LILLWLAPFHNEDEDIMSMRVKREKRIGWKNVQKSSEKKKKKVGKLVGKNIIFFLITSRKQAFQIFDLFFSFLAGM
jgi:hypothetical protein